jgi:hypothetical protein
MKAGRPHGCEPVPGGEEKNHIRDRSGLGVAPAGQNGRLGRQRSTAGNSPPPCRSLSSDHHGCGEHEQARRKPPHTANGADRFFESGDFRPSQALGGAEEVQQAVPDQDEHHGPTNAGTHHTNAPTG